MDPSMLMAMFGGGGDDEGGGGGGLQGVGKGLSQMAKSRADEMKNRPVHGQQGQTAPGLNMQVATPGSLSAMLGNYVDQGREWVHDVTGISWLKDQIQGGKDWLGSQVQAGMQTLLGQETAGQALQEQLKQHPECQGLEGEALQNCLQGSMTSLDEEDIVEEMLPNQAVSGPVRAAMHDALMGIG